MEELKTAKGLVGFFDILGYKNIIRNEQIEYTANIISKIIKKLPQITKDKIVKDFAETFNMEEAKAENLYDAHIDWMVFSDTILIFSEISDDSVWQRRNLIALQFLAFSGNLLGLSFDEGFPLRGCISYGPYFYEDLCFAGKPIVDAYELAQKMEFCGCGFTEEAEKFFNGLYWDTDSSFKDMYRLFLFDYLAPLKDSEERILLINWLFFKKEKPQDIRQYLVKAFHAHKKEVPRVVLPKIENTEIILRHSFDAEWNPKPPRDKIK